MTFAPPDLGRSRGAKLRRWFRSIATGTPVWILNRYSAQLDATLCATAGDFDVIVFLGEAAGIYSVHCRSACKHLDKANVMSRSSAQDAAHATSYRRKLRLGVIAWLSKRYERRVLRSIHSVAVTSSEEAERLEADYGRAADAILPSAIEVIDQPSQFDPAGRHVVWLGSLEYRSNVDGLQRFLAQGVPILYNAGLTFVVVGSGSSPHIAALCRATQGVEYRGFVADLTSLAPFTRAAVVPLWSGAGVKLKTLTLMNLGLPVAATSVAMEGIDHAAALAVSDDCRALSERIVGASVQELAAARERGLATVRQKFSSYSFTERIASSFGTDTRQPARAWP
jgi:polysaccharide biosynthesis protein PslH